MPVRADIYKFVTAQPSPTPPPTVHVTGVTINPSPLSYLLGTANYPLSAVITPSNATNKTVIWTVTLNPDKAAVDAHGVVSALTGAGAGQNSTIRATAQDGGAFAECTVNFTSAPVDVQGVTISDSSSVALPSTIPLTAGDVLNMTGVIAPSTANENTTVTWSASNTNVVSLSSTTGTAIQVTANAPLTGSPPFTSTVTASVTDGSSATHQNTVTITVNVPVTGVSLDKTSLDLNVSQTSTLTPTLSPANPSNQTVNWTSSDSSIATVTPASTSGSAPVTIRGIAAGTATITATTADGGHTAPCAVTVGNALNSITLSAATVPPLVVGHSDSSLHAAFSPTNATNQTITWTSSPNGIVSVVGTVSGTSTTSGTETVRVTALGAGTATITATPSDTGSGATAKTATVSVTTTPVLTFAYQVNTSNVSVYPVTDATGALSASVSQGTGATFSFGLGAVTPNGKAVYVFDNALPSPIAVFSISGSTLSKVQSINVNPSIRSNTSKLVCDPASRFVFALNTASTFQTLSVFVIQSDGTLVEAPNSPHTLAGSPQDMVLDPSGNFLYISEVVTSPSPNVFSYSILPSGDLVAVNSQSTPSSFPRALAIDPTGTRLYASLGTGTIVVYPTDGAGNLSTPAGPFTANVSIPSGGGTFVVVDKTGAYLYYGSGTSVTGVNLNSDGSLGTAISGSPFSTSPISVGSTLTLDPTGRYLYVSDAGGTNGNTGFSIGPSGVLTLIPGFPISGGNTSGFMLITNQ